MTEHKADDHKADDHKGRELPDDVIDKLEREAGEYWAKTFNALRHALDAEKLTETMGVGPATGVLNGVLQFAISMWLGSGADLNTMQRTLAGMWRELEHNGPGSVTEPSDRAD